ncbi:flavin reductase family protein [Nocardioides sp. DS6]|uniref:Flavin reductase family protein n=1 Tax=Nocardioides eburneus TaxID=3231482 RepID=A0ABV3SY17_9ACTN
MAMRPLSTDEFDAFVEGLDYPVFVVTAYDGHERAGCLVGFATQASIDPPRLLVCLSEANHTLRVAERADLLAVHLLGADDHPLAARFGGETGDEVDKFADVRWHPGPGGVPLLDDLPRYVVGRVLERLPLGDHVGHLLAPVAEHTDEQRESDETLTYQGVDDVEPGHPA